ALTWAPPTSQPMSGGDVRAASLVWEATGAAVGAASGAGASGVFDGGISGLGGGIGKCGVVGGNDVGGEVAWATGGAAWRADGRGRGGKPGVGAGLARVDLDDAQPAVGLADEVEADEAGQPGHRGGAALGEVAQRRRDRLDSGVHAGVGELAVGRQGEALAVDAQHLDTPGGTQQ